MSKAMTVPSKKWYRLKKVDFRHMQVASDYLKEIISKQISNSDLGAICTGVLIDCKFRTYPASLRFHHAYSGGLMVHTAEVTQFAEMMMSVECANLDPDVLLGAAICHDCGKIFDYSITTDTVSSETRGYYTAHNKYIRHVSRSYAEFMQEARRVELDGDLTEKVGHCILAHHGRQEWGSPVEPETPEAYALHFADMLSLYAAKQKECRI